MLFILTIFVAAICVVSLWKENLSTVEKLSPLVWVVLSPVLAFVFLKISGASERDTEALTLMGGIILPIVLCPIHTGVVFYLMRRRFYREIALDSGEEKGSGPNDEEKGAEPGL